MFKMVAFKRVGLGAAFVFLLVLISLVILGIISSRVIAWLVLIVLIVGMALVGFGKKDSVE